MNQKGILQAIKDNNIEYQTINGNQDWQKKVSLSLDNCKSKIILIGQTGILGKEFVLKRNDRLFLNCHPGKLPFYRGIDSFKWCLFEKNFNAFSTTIHIVRDKLDGGEILQIDNYDWEKVNWFLADNQLLAKSGENLAKYALELQHKKDLKDILKTATNQKVLYPLYFKMNFIKELKTFYLYIKNKKNMFYK